MPDPNAHDQPAEGGVETVERALQKQSEPKRNKKPAGQTDTGGTDRSNKSTDSEGGR